MERTRLETLLDLTSAPVAIRFVASAPSGVPRVDEAEPVGAGDNDAYFAIPGDKLEAIVARVEVVLRANAELEKFHRARLPIL
jgi:hypothetical protein